MLSEKKAVVAGHICLDMTPVFPKNKVSDIHKVMTPGKLIQMNGIDIHTGGAVANTGLAMKMLGVDAKLMGKIGDDELGSIVMNVLRKYDAQEGMIISKESETSYSVVLAVPGIDRIFLHSPGANDTFSYEDIDFSAVEEAHLFHFGYPTVMKQLYQNGGEELVGIIQAVKNAGTAVSLDMAAIDAESEAALEDWEEILKNTLSYVDFFLPSAEELCYMLDKERYEVWKQRAGDKDLTDVLTLKDLAPIGKKVIEMGANVVLIKCGASGIYYKTACKNKIQSLCHSLNLSEESWADKEGFEVSYEPEAIVSGTGAGDTCIAAFLSSVLCENSLEQSLKLATAEGACCVAAYDALGGIKKLEELEQMIQNGWKKNMYSV